MSWSHRQLSKTWYWAFPIPHFQCACETTVFFFNIIIWDGRDVWNGWGFVCFCFHSPADPVSQSFSLHILTLPVLQQELQASVRIYQLLGRFEPKYLTCSSSFTSYSGHESAVVKDAILVFLKQSPKRRNRHLGKRLIWSQSRCLSW